MTAEGARGQAVLPADHLRGGLLPQAHGGPPGPEAREPAARQQPQCQDSRLW